MDTEDSKSRRLDVSMADAKNDTQKAGGEMESGLSSMVRDKMAVDIANKTGGLVDPDSKTWKETKSAAEECKIKKILQLDHLTEKKRFDKYCKSRRTGSVSSIGGSTWEVEGELTELKREAEKIKRENEYMNKATELGAERRTRGE